MVLVRTERESPAMPDLPERLFKMAKKFSPANPSARAASLAAFIAGVEPTLADSVSPGLVQAFFDYHDKWQRSAERHAERNAEKAEAAERRAAELRERKAKQIAAAKKLLEDAGEIATPAPSGRTQKSA